MCQHKFLYALTTDKHFEQEGFIKRARKLIENPDDITHEEQETMRYNHA
jgi:hypothetical protein